MEPQGSRKKFNIPQGLKPLLEEISLQVLRKQPENTYEFIADYLERKLQGIPEEPAEAFESPLGHHDEEEYRLDDLDEEGKPLGQKSGKVGKDLGKAELFTEDGQPVRYSPSGQMMNSKGEVIPPGTKLLTNDGKEMKKNSKGEFYDNSGKQVFLTKDGGFVTLGDNGTLVDSNGKPVPPGTQLKTPSGEPVAVSPTGKPVAQSKDGKDGAKPELFTEDGQPVRYTPSGQMINSKGDAIPPGTKLLTSDGKEMRKNSKGELVDNNGKPILLTKDGGFVTLGDNGILVDSNGKPVPPGTQLKTPSGEPVTVSPTGKPVPLSQVGKDVGKPELFTEDGQLVSYSPSGQMINSKGEVIPPGTKLLTSDGKEMRRNSKGEFYDNNGRPIFLTQDGGFVTLGDNGTLVDSSGKPVPPGTQLKTPSGEPVAVSPTGKPVPLSGDEDHYATVIQAAFRGHMVRKNSNKKGSRDDSNAPKLYDEKGREVRVTPSGHALTLDGKPISPGSKLRTSSNKEINVGPDGTVFPPRKSVSKLYTEDGKPVRMTENGGYETADGEPLPPGAKLLTSDGKELKKNSKGELVDNNGKPVFLTKDGGFVTLGDNGILVDSNGKPIPPGTQLKTPSGEPITVSPTGKPTPLSKEGKDGANPELFTEDGQPVRFTPSGQMINTKGEIIPPGTKLLTSDGKEMRRNSKGEFYDNNGKPIFLTEDGSFATLDDGILVDSNGKPVPPGTQLKTPSGEAVAVSPTGKPVSLSKEGKDFGKPQLFTEDGQPVRYSPSGQMINSKGEVIPPGTKLLTSDGKEMRKNSKGELVDNNGKPIFLTKDGNVVTLGDNGILVDSNGKPVPPGTQLKTPSGEPVAVSPTGKPVSLSQVAKDVGKPELFTEDGQPVSYTPSGQMINSKGQVIPPGTKLLTKDGKEMRRHSKGEFYDNNGRPIFLTEDGGFVTLGDNGVLVDSSGKPVPPGTQLKTPSGEPVTVSPTGKPVPLFGDADRYATVIQAAFRGHMVRKNSLGKDHRSSKDGKPDQASVYKTESGKTIRITPSGTLVDQDGKPVPPGTKLTSFSGQPVVVSSAGTPIPRTSIHEHVDKVLSKALDLVDVLENIDGQVPQQSNQPASEWLTNYWSSQNIHDQPVRRSNPGDTALDSMAEALTMVLEEENSMGPIEAFIDMIQKAIEALISKLTSSPADMESGVPEASQGDVVGSAPGVSPGVAPPPNSMFDNTGKIQFYTADGQPVRYSPSGQMINSKGEVIPPGTKLVTSDGKETRRSSKGEFYDNNGKPIFLTEDGRFVTLGDNGIVVDSNGKPVPPGTQLKTPSGEPVAVSPTGKPVPLSGDADRYATVIQAAFRGHMVRRNSHKRSSKDDSNAPKLYDENGREVRVTPSGHALTLDGKPIPPGSKLRTSSNKEISVSPDGTVFPPRKSVSKLYTEDGRPVRLTDIGGYETEDGEPLPPGTKIKISGSKEMIVTAGGGVEAAERPRRMSGRMFTEDGLEIEATPSGRVITMSGGPAPEDTKIKTIDLKHIISGDENFPETNLFTESGTPVVVTSSGRVFTVKGKELFPGTLLKTSDNRLMTVSPSGGVVLRPATSVPLALNAEPKSSNPRVEGTQSGGALTTPTGRNMDKPPSAVPSRSDQSPVRIRKLFTEDGEEVLMGPDGKLLTKNGEQVIPGSTVVSGSGQSLKVTPSGRPAVETASGNLVPHEYRPAGAGPPNMADNTGQGGPTAAANELLAPPAAIVADMAGRRNTGPKEGMLSEEQADPEEVMVEWATTVDEFMTDQVSTVERLLNGDLPLAEARGTIIFLTVSFVVGLVIGYGIARSLGLVGPPRSHAPPTNRIGSLTDIGSLLGPDGHPLSHGVDPGAGKCTHK